MRFPLAEQIVIIDQRMTLVASDTQSPWWSGGKQNWLMPSWMDSARNQTPIVADSSKRHLTGVSLPFVALKQTFPRRRQMTNGARDWPNRRVTQRRETLWSTSQLTTVPHFRWNVHLHNSFTSALGLWCRRWQLGHRRVHHHFNYQDLKCNIWRKYSGFSASFSRIMCAVSTICCRKVDVICNVNISADNDIQLRDRSQSFR